MQKSIVNSIAFFSCLREFASLSNPKHKKYITENATDYEVIYFAATGNFPKEKYNRINENFLVEVVRRQLKTEELKEMDELVKTLQPLSESGMSSNPTILSYLMETSLNDKISKINKLYYSGGKDVDNRDLKNLKYDANEYKNKMLGNTSEKLRKRKIKLQAMKTKIEQDAIDGNLKNYDKDKAEFIKLGTQYNKDAKKYDRKKEDIVDRVGTRLNINKDDYGSYAKGQADTEAKPSKNSLYNKKESKHSNIMKSTEGTPNVTQTQKKTMPKETPITKNNKPTVPHDEITKPKSVNNLLQTIKSNPAKTFYGAMIGAGILYGGYKIYQRFLSKAARACSNKSGEEKTACIAQYRNNAIKAQIMELKKGLSVCAKTNNPAKCKATIEDKIKKLQNKLG